MRSNKRFTNTVFTKRVDHEEGHKSALHPTEPAICTQCHAVYAGERWTAASNTDVPEPRKRTEVRETLCPACIQIKSGEPSGFVFIDGKFVPDHMVEIQNLLRNENEKTAEVNPLARIMEIKSAGDQLVVTTTTEHLAQQLGRSLGHAFGGDVRYDFSHENKLARVHWHRD